MSRAVLSLLASLTALCVSAADFQPATLAPGSSAPTFNVPGVDGRNHPPKDFADTGIGMLSSSSTTGNRHAPINSGSFRLGSGSSQLVVNSNGALVAWTGMFDEPASPQGTTAGEILYRGKTLKLGSPEVSRTGKRLSFTYRWASEPGLEVAVEHQVAKNQGACLWTRQVEVRGEMNLASDLTVCLRLLPEPLPRSAWLPLLNGTGAELGTNQAAAFRFAGQRPDTGVLLALPMVSLLAGSEPGRVLIAADPYFSALFRGDTVVWTYPAKAGLADGCERRTIVLARHPGSIEGSLAWFYRAVLPDVQPGAAWLHEIALVDFDYMSDGGRGWFRDIDGLSGALTRKDRRQLFLCLHGWYDFLGRYCFDESSGKLDREWTAFSNWTNARTAHPFGTIGGERVEMGFENCKPVKMSLAEVHRRLQYARARGFRAGLYFADGVNAGDGLADFGPDRVLEWGGWQGPDSRGKSYLQNPLHPGVRAFFVDYTRALLAEFGPDLDALVWDETFHVPCGRLGTEAWPGYADRAMMRLVREVVALVEAYNRQHRRSIALLTSDCLGAFGADLKGPYALVSHGTFQDSWCQPGAWSYGIFANYRNVLWSCCWWPVTKWSWVEFGVREYQAPVSISNGWGNDQGFAELTPQQQARVLQLFNWRKQQPTRLRWFSRLPDTNSIRASADKRHLRQD